MGGSVSTETKESGFPVALLFRHGRAKTTALLWLMFFSNVMLVMVLNSWLTTILSKAGMAERLAVILASAVNVGGLCGSVVFALIYDRLRSIGFYLLGAAFFLGACFVAATGLVRESVPLVAACMLLRRGSSPIADWARPMRSRRTLYPISIRSTGGAWAIGIGQIARVIGPPVAGVLLASGWGEAQMLGLIAVPGFIAAVAATLIAILNRRDSRSR